MSEKTPITFKPKQIVKKLLSVLGDRAQDVLTSRFGLGNDTKRMTLEAIGKKYKITRERV
jgi:DNA-directed RNA polymerase sigma subunit (sigma70/sigma32)